MKNRIRTEYRALRRDIPGEVRRAADKKICAAFLASASYRYCETVLLFSPTWEEVNVNAIADAAVASGKSIAYPRCDPRTHIMNYCKVPDRSCLVKGAFGIYEPTADCPSIDKTEASGCVCLIPAVVFDRKGYRIGYGKGYYDRFLSVFPCSKIGIVYKNFIVDRVPAGKFDVRVDVIITEGGFYSIDKN